MMKSKSYKKKVKRIIEYSTDKTKWRSRKEEDVPIDVMDRPSVYHATVVIFLEFFAWGLLTSPSVTLNV